MKVSIKNRTDGTVFQVEIEANATIGELRSKISSHLGNSCDPRSLKLSLGEQLLDDADSVTLKKAGLVSGDPTLHGNVRYS
ncbi:ubiquitin family protein [Ostertagia ostertagi]